jgi:hypothetical protein
MNIQLAFQLFSTRLFGLFFVSVKYFGPAKEGFPFARPLLFLELVLKERLRQ